MLWRKILNNINSRFIFVTTIGILILSFVSLASIAFIRTASLDAEVSVLVENQIKNVLSTHQVARKQQDYLSLSRILNIIPHVEAVAFYDKDCNLLNSTYLTEFPESICPIVSRNLKTIEFRDAISPIGSISYLQKTPSLSVSDISFIFLFCVIFALMCCLIVILGWKGFVYAPLKREISNLASGASTPLAELGELGLLINRLVTTVKTTELRVERMKFEEERAKIALKVAHDILAPIRLVKSDSSLTYLSPESQSAIIDIEDIALDLLPEKKGLNKSVLSPLDVLQDVISRSTAHAETFVPPTLSIKTTRQFFTSKPHLSRALTNIVKNALEVQPHGVPIRITCDDFGLDVRVIISDDGPGFYPQNDQQTTKLQGSGLGLKSAREALDNIGALLSHESSPNGTSFSIIVPTPPNRIWLSPNELAYSFGYDRVAPGITRLNDLSVVANSDRRCIIISPFPRSLDTPNLRWITVPIEKFDSIELMPLYRALLIEDDKYVIQKWRAEASASGVELRISKDLDVAPMGEEHLFVDQHLGHIDSTQWCQTQRQMGARISSISCLASKSSKTPPWLLSELS